MIDVFCIKGPCHGMKLRISPNYDYVQVPLKPNLPVVTSRGPDTKIEKNNFEIAVYKLMYPDLPGRFLQYERTIVI